MGFFKQIGKKKGNKSAASSQNNESANNSGKSQEEELSEKTMFLSPEEYYISKSPEDSQEEAQEDYMPARRDGANDIFIQGGSDYLLHITEDHAEALITVYRPFDMAELKAVLKEQGIIQGLLEKKLQEVAQGLYDYEEVLIARGTSPKDGRDGFFEYHFNPSPETRPIILPDGSVDYNVLGKIELVKSDQLLVTYHPAVPGKKGASVFGQTVDAYDGVELPPLQCKNSRLEPEENKYYAKVEGNVTIEKGVLTVTPLYLVEGNLDAATGDVDFHGDVLVQGNVFAGVTVRTTGNITINGHVETASLYAGKDVILKNGMQGSGTGVIHAKGNVFARFLEQTKVYAGNEINTGALLNCDVESGNSIIVAGNRGSIIGGTVMAAEYISVASLGNRVGVKTQVIIGLEKDFKSMMEEIDRLTTECQDELSDALRDLETLSFRMKSQPATPELSSQKTELTRTKIRCQSRLSELATKRKQLIDINQRSADGKIVITGSAYTGVSIIINGVREILHSECKDVTIKKSRKEIRIVSNKL